MVKIKYKEFIGAAPIMPCQNSLWIMGFRSMEKGEPDSSDFTHYDRSFSKDPG